MSRSSKRSTAEVPLDTLVSRPSRARSASKQEREGWRLTPPQKPTQKLGFHSPCPPYAGPSEFLVPELEPKYVVRYNPARCAPFGSFEVYRYGTVPQLLGGQLSYPDYDDCKRVEAASRALVTAAAVMRIGHYTPRVRALPEAA